MQDTAGTWLMTSLTASPLLIALMQTAASLPVLGLGLLAGATADLFDRRRLLIFWQVWMLVSVRPEHLSELRVGQAATVTLPGMSGQRFSGKIMYLGQEFDATTRAMQARIVLDNRGNLLRPEMLANAEISTGSRKPTILVVSDAVQQINGQDAVFVRTAADRFVVRAVRIGETVNGKTPVLEGLKPGEQIVVRGSFILKSQLLRASMEGE